MSEPVTALKLISTIATRFGLNRGAVRGHLKHLRRFGLVKTQGRTRATKYTLAILSGLYREYRRAGLEEHAVWDEIAKPFFAVDNANVQDVCNYALTEIINNAIDHSGAETVNVTLYRTAKAITMTVEDDGIGIFNKLRDTLGLDDTRHVVFELEKGKLTTDPERHTGEGIYFTSRMCDTFVLESDDVLVLYHQHRDTVFNQTPAHRGTGVIMILNLPLTRTTNEVFEGAMGDEIRFANANVVLKLAGDTLVSRSEAKRVLARADQFGLVTLNFDGIASIGPAFADEIFRVFQRAHPEITIVPLNANADVQRMIERARAAEMSAP